MGIAMCMQKWQLLECFDHFYKAPAALYQTYTEDNKELELNHRCQEIIFIADNPSY